MKDYGMFICQVCNELGHKTRGEIVPNPTNPKENIMVHKRCSKTVYKQLWEEKPKW